MAYDINGLVHFSITGPGKYINSLRYANYRRPDKRDEAPDFRISLGRFKPDLENCDVLDDKYYIKYNYIYCKDKYKTVSWEIEIKNFEHEGPVDININIKHDILLGSVAYPIICGFIIDSMIYYSLISRGLAPVHASCASKGHMAYIFTGRSGAGKTTVILQLIKNGYRYVNDDIVILCPQNKAVGFVKSLNLFSYNVDDQFYNNLAFEDKVKIKFYNIVYKLSKEYVKIFTHVNPAQIFHDNIDMEELDVKSVFVLLPKNGPVSVREGEMSKDDVISNIHFNLSLEMLHLYKYFLAYSYVYPDTPTANIYDKYKDNINKNLNLNKYYKIDVPKKYDKSTFKEISRLVSYT